MVTISLVSVVALAVVCSHTFNTGGVLIAGVEGSISAFLLIFAECSVSGVSGLAFAFSVGVTFSVEVAVLVSVALVCTFVTVSIETFILFTCTCEVSWDISADSVWIAFFAWAVNNVCAVVSGVTVESGVTLTLVFWVTVSVVWAVEVVDTFLVGKFASGSVLETITLGTVWAGTLDAEAVLGLCAVGVFVADDVLHAACSHSVVDIDTDVVWKVVSLQVFECLGDKTTVLFGSIFFCAVESLASLSLFLGIVLFLIIFIRFEAVGGVAGLVDLVAVVTLASVVSEIVDTVGAGLVTLGNTVGAFVDVGAVFVLWVLFLEAILALAVEASVCVVASLSLWVAVVGVQGALIVIVAFVLLLGVSLQACAVEGSLNVDAIVNTAWIVLALVHIDAVLCSELLLITLQACAVVGADGVVTVVLATFVLGALVDVKTFAIDISVALLALACV